jgi:hypothetical protein
MYLHYAQDIGDDGDDDDGGICCVDGSAYLPRDFDFDLSREPLLQEQERDEYIDNMSLSTRDDASFMWSEFEEMTKARIQIAEAAAAVRSIRSSTTTTITANTQNSNSNNNEDGNDDELLLLGLDLSR